MCVRLQVKPTQLDPVDRASHILLTERITLNKRQDYGVMSRNSVTALLYNRHELRTGEYEAATVSIECLHQAYNVFCDNYNISTLFT
jgi:hypothetical protein